MLERIDSLRSSAAPNPPMSSIHLMQTAEEERLTQPPLVDDGVDEFGAAMRLKAALATSKSAPPSGAINHASSNGSNPIANGRTNTTTMNKSSSTPSTISSPSASSSPHHSFQLPYYHPPSVFQVNAPFLATNMSPSQLDGFTAKEEFHLRAHTCVFMSGIGLRLKLRQLATATASVFVQVFFTHYSFKAVDRLELALTCLFLAGKVEERRVRIDDCLHAYYIEKDEFEKKLAFTAGEGHLYRSRPMPIRDSPEWDQLRTRVYEYEAILLDAIEYNFDVMHPYSYLRKFLEKFIYSGFYAKESQDHGDNAAMSSKSRVRDCLSQLVSHCDSFYRSMLFLPQLQVTLSFSVI